jgi:hypothetical protein
MPWKDHRHAHARRGASVWDPDRGELIEHPGPEEYPRNSVRDVARRGVDVHRRPSAADQRPARSRRPPGPPHRAAGSTYLSTPSRWFEPTTHADQRLIDGTGDVGTGRRPHARVNDAFGAWTNAPGRTRAGRRRPPARTGHVRRLRGGNRIVFNDPFGEIADPTSGGVLAIGGFCASSRRGS